VRLLPLVLACALVALSAPAPAEPLGRLFYTPDQREALDTARNKKTRGNPDTEKEKPAVEAPPAPEIVTYGGIVRRSDGKTTVWLNNRAVNEKDKGSGAVLSAVRPDGRVTLHSPQTGRNVDLKVGQRAELLSGSVEEGYSRRPLPASRPETTTIDSPAGKPAADVKGGTPASERSRDDQDREDRVDKVLRKLEETANARSETPPAQLPGQAPAQMYK